MTDHLSKLKMHFVTSLLLLSLASVILAACSNRSFRCPTGETFAHNTCKDIKTSIAGSHCPKYGQNGDVKKWYARDNGSNAPKFLGIRKGFTNVFRESCAIHDMCYSTPGTRQGKCDADFHYNMRENCKFPRVKVFFRWFCKFVAKTAYISVKSFGKKYFSNAQNDFAQYFTKVKN